jgi:hypothetical protein
MHRSHPVDTVDMPMLECDAREERHTTSRSELCLFEEEEEEEEEDIVAAGGGDCSGELHGLRLPEEGAMSYLSPAPEEFTIGSAWRCETEYAAKVGTD